MLNSIPLQNGRKKYYLLLLCFYLPTFWCILICNEGTLFPPVFIKLVLYSFFKPFFTLESYLSHGTETDINHQNNGNKRTVGVR